MLLCFLKTLINGDLELSGYRTASQDRVDAKCGTTDNLNKFGYYYCVYSGNKTTNSLWCCLCSI